MSLMIVKALFIRMTKICEENYILLTVIFFLFKKIEFVAFAFLATFTTHLLTFTLMSPVVICANFRSDRYLVYAEGNSSEKGSI